MESAVASLEELQEAMADWGVPPPSEGWAAWSQSFKDVLEQSKAPPTADGASYRSVAKFNILPRLPIKNPLRVV